MLSVKYRFHFLPCSERNLRRDKFILVFMKKLMLMADDRWYQSSREVYFWCLFSRDFNVSLFDLYTLSRLALVALRRDRLDDPYFYFPRSIFILFLAFRMILAYLFKAEIKVNKRFPFILFSSFIFLMYV